MSFEGIEIDIGIEETKRRRKGSAIPSFTGDLDLNLLARGMPFPTSEAFGQRSARNLLLAQRGRIESTPLRVKAEGNIQDAFLTNPLAAPSIDPSRKSNGKRKSRLSKSRSKLLKENRRLSKGKVPRNRRQAENLEIKNRGDFNFRRLGIDT